MNKFLIPCLLLIPFLASCGADTATSSTKNSSTALSALDVQTGDKLDLTIHIGGMELTGYVQVNSLNTSNGSLSGDLYISGMSAPLAIEGNIDGSSFTVNDFTLKHNFAEGQIKNLKTLRQLNCFWKS